MPITSAMTKDTSSKRIRMSVQSWLAAMAWKEQQQQQQQQYTHEEEEEEEEEGDVMVG